MPAGGHAGEEPVAQAGHPLPGALGAHGLAQLVGLGRGEPGHVDGDLHELLLEQRHPERLAPGPAASSGCRGVTGLEALLRRRM